MIVGGFNEIHGDSGIIAGDDCIDSPEGLGCGVGDCTSMVVKKGVLCGNGDISIGSATEQGEEGVIGAETETVSVNACLLF